MTVLVMECDTGIRYLCCIGFKHNLLEPAAQRLTLSHTARSNGNFR
jgi:hypothetical protein